MNLWFREWCFLVISCTFNAFESQQQNQWTKLVFINNSILYPAIWWSVTTIWALYQFFIENSGRDIYYFHTQNESPFISTYIWYQHHDYIYIFIQFRSGVETKVQLKKSGTSVYFVDILTHSQIFDSVYKRESRVWLLIFH